MKILIDNELKDFRKIVMVKSSFNFDLDDDLNTIIDALKACSYTEENIHQAFLDKIIEWDIIGGIDND